MSHIRNTAWLEIPGGGLSSSVRDVQHNHLLTMAIGLCIPDVQQDAAFTAISKASLPITASVDKRPVKHKN